MNDTAPPGAIKLKIIGFGYAEEREAHHFVVAIPRAAQGEVMIYEVFHRDLAGPALESANLRVRLDRDRWLRIAEATEEEFNRRLRSAGLRPARWKIGPNPVARLLGKELVLLAWAIENADPELAPNAVQNWRGLAPEERWWLYTMTAAQTGHHSKHQVGWRKAVRYALTENPTAPGPVSPKAPRERFTPTKSGSDQRGLFDVNSEQAACAAGIWEQPR
ncbi:MAG: DUF3780 domain-containing protein [Alphaproteobacteria bacterium]